MQSFRPAGPVWAFVSRYSWNGDQGDWRRATEVAQSLGVTVVEGDWTSESEQRQYAYQHMKTEGCTHCLIPDTDEVIEPALLSTIRKIVEADLADRIHVEMDTYWKSAEYVIRPRERLTPAILINLDCVQHVHIRHFEGGRGLTLGSEYGVLHHLSYAGSDERILRKISTWSHKDEVVPNWFTRIWKGWDADPFLHNLHPTHPEAYGFAERIPVPAILKPLAPTTTQLSTIPESDSPSVSVIIPVYGEAECLRDCLDHLGAFADRLHEVIVVDNASKDDAAQVARSYPFVTLIESEVNLGFGGACNLGIQRSTGDFVLLLNSDAYLPQVGLEAMLKSISVSGSIAAVGPLSNNVGHFQKLDVTYTALERMPLFAEAFARLDRPDVDTDMLVAFCLLVRRTCLNEVGLFDERFGLGLFEDNDLCYRLRRSGYRLVISGRAYCHHEGSKTVRSAIEKPHERLEANKGLYIRKWKDDLDLGYASTLSGLGPDKIVFNDARKPDAVKDIFRTLAKQARISLCMIVKNEERVLGECLASTEPFFFERIVVDTGSTDRTREIVNEHGAQLHEFPWTDSFSEARNESLKYATGDWIFWMDADDTLPLASGEAILQAVLNAPPEIHGFVVPVQFVEDGPNAGTRVDHVKLFRRYPDLRFSLRIHEQILPSLSEHEGLVARCEAVVLHSGYDTSPEGQKRKRERDAKLLRLDLEENPDHPFVLFNLGMTDHFLGEHESAIQWLERSIQVAKGEESHVRKAYALLGLSVRELRGPIEAIRVFEEGVRAVGWDPELWFHLGMTNAQIGALDQAIAAYEMVLADEPAGFYSSYDVSIRGHKTLFNLAAAHLQKGDYPRARELWEECLRIAPTFLPAAFACFDAAIREMDKPPATRMLSHVREIEGASQSWSMMFRQYLESLGAS